MRDVPRNGFDKRWRLRRGGAIPSPDYLLDSRNIGEKVYDASGYDHTATWSGTSDRPVTTDRGLVPFFGGSTPDDYIDLEKWFTPADMTITLWCKAYSDSAGGRYGLWQVGDGGGSDGHYLMWDNGDEIRWCGKDWNINYALIAADLDDGFWHFIAGTATGNTTSVWLDGVKGTDGTVTRSTDTTYHTIGLAFQPSFNRFWHGAIDQFAFYPRVLSDSTIDAIRLSQMPGGPGLQGRSFSRHLPAAVAAGGDGGFTATALSLTAALQGIPVAANKTLELTL